MTFRNRLSLQVTLLCLVVLAVAGTIVFFGARTALLSNVDGALLEIARSELASALDGPDGTVHIHEDSQLILQGASGYEKYALIRDEHGDFAAHTTNIEVADLATLAPNLLNKTKDGFAVFGDITLKNIPLRAVYYPFQDKRGISYTAVCAVPYAPMEQSLKLLGVTILSALSLCGLGALWGARRLSARLTNPLAQMARQAQHIGETSLHERLPTLSQDEEIVSVTNSMNAMLGRLEGAFAERERMIRERERMIEAQRQFLMDASHELRTPVSNVRGTIEVTLRRPRNGETYKETLETCLPEVERLSILVNDVLLLARAEAGSLSLTKEPLDFVLLLHQAVQAHQAGASIQEIEICLDCDASLPFTGDPTRLRQIIDNLLDNALRFAPRHSHIKISATKDDKSLCFCVQDQGNGIAPEDIPHLFERFWRSDASRTRATGGMGLGLSITKTLVEAHNGTISVESNLGKGSRFDVRFPTT
jgi:two-component system, OmpR family, sensor kinase